MKCKEIYLFPPSGNLPVRRSFAPKERHKPECAVAGNNGGGSDLPPVIPVIETVRSQSFSLHKDRAQTQLKHR